MSFYVLPEAASLPIDGRQSETALAVARGTVAAAAIAWIFDRSASCRCRPAGAPTSWR